MGPGHDISSFRHGWSPARPRAASRCQAPPRCTTGRSGSGWPSRGIAAHAALPRDRRGGAPGGAGFLDHLAQAEAPGGDRLHEGQQRHVEERHLVRREDVDRPRHRRRRARHEDEQPPVRELVHHQRRALALLDGGERRTHGLPAALNERPLAGEGLRQPVARDLLEQERLERAPGPPASRRADQEADRQAEQQEQHHGRDRRVHETPRKRIRGVLQPPDDAEDQQDDGPERQHHQHAVHQRAPEVFHCATLLCIPAWFMGRRATSRRAWRSPASRRHDRARDARRHDASAAATGRNAGRAPIDEEPNTTWAVPKQTAPGGGRTR